MVGERQIVVSLAGGFPRHLRANAKLPLSLAAILLLPLLTGCASMGKYDKGYAYPFTATGADIGMTYYAIAGKPEDEAPDPFDFIYSPWCIPLFILDLPLSVVTDTLTLPYDLWHIRDVGDARGDKSQQDRESPIKGSSRTGDPRGGSPAGQP